MAEHLTAEDLRAWLRYHEIDPEFVRSIRINSDTFRHGMMLVEIYTTHPKDPNARLLGQNDVLVESRYVALRALPGQETIWDG